MAIVHGPGNPKNDGKEAATVFSIAVLITSLSLNVVLGWRLKNAPGPPVQMAGIQKGDFLPSLPVISLSGAKEQLRLDQASLLYVFSPACSWCRADYSNVIALSNATKARLSFVGITKDDIGITGYLRQHPFPGNVLKLDLSRVPKPIAVKFGITPQTILLGAGGIVERSWVGALMDDRKRDIEHFFGVVLPGPSLPSHNTQ
jgi:hypothetical protein